MTLSLKWRIALNMWLLAAVCTLVAASIVLWLLFQNEERELKQQLKSTATTLISLKISNYHGLEGFQQLESVVNEVLKLENMTPLIQVYTRKGKLMFRSPLKEFPDINIPFETVQQPVFKKISWQDQFYKILITPYKAKNGKTYYLQVAMRAPLLRDIARATWVEGILLFLFLSLLAFLISQLLAQKLITPVKSIAVYLQKLSIAETRDWKPLQLSGYGGYLNDITIGINGLTRQVKSALYSISRTRRYLAHELKNPLTILTGEAENVLGNQKATFDEYRAVLYSSLEELERINNVVETVVRISKSERNVYQPVPCNLSEWLDYHRTALEKISKKEICWVKPPDAFIVTIDPDLLYRVIENLIRNIKAHTAHHTSCEIRLYREQGVTRIAIMDNGPGMPRALIELLNQGQIIPGRIGIGLGLCLCLEIASICHFKMNFSNRASGGLCVQIIFDE